MTVRLSVMLALAVAPAAGAGDFRGRILAENKPLAGVTVAAVPLETPLDETRREALRQEEPKPILSVVTRPDGTFSLLLPATAGVVRVRVSGGGTAPALLGRVLDAAEGDDLGDITVQKGAALLGRVVDTHGGPVVAATVTLRGGGRLPGREIASVPVTATTGADGSFRFADATEAGNDLRVEAPGFATAELRGVRGGALRKAVSLVPGRAISGSVSLPDRRTPAAGALVRFEGSAMTTRWVEARRDGTFLVDGVPAASGSLVADGGERGRASAPAPEAGAKASLVLAPTAGVRGRVVDASTAAAVTGIRVVARCGAATFTGRAGAAGRYEIRGLPPGSCRLSADDPRYVAWTGRVTVTAGATEEKDVPLVRAAMLVGRVVDPDGRPVEGASGQVFRNRENPMRAFLRLGGEPIFRSGRDGTFKASRLAPGTNLRLTVRHEDFEPRTLGGIALVAGATKSGLTVVLSRGLTVRGFVKDEAGLPLAGAEVELQRSRMFSQSGRRGEMVQFGMMGGPGQQPKRTTGADGRFEFRGLTAGDYTLVASKKGLTRERVDPLKVAEGPEGEPVQLVLRAGVAITGYVRDKAGNGVAGWVVGVRPQGGSAGPLAGLLGQGPPERTGPDGSFLIEGLTAGETYELQPFSESGPGPRKSGVVAPADVEIVISGRGKIRGTVVDADTGRPIPDFEVGYVMASRGGGMAFRFRTTDGGRGAGDPVSFHAEDGAFVLDDVAAGSWDVQATAEGYQRGRVAGVTVEEGATAEGVDVRLARGGTISGRVLEDRTGKPVLEASVRAEPASGGGGMRMMMLDDDGPTVTDAEGRFQLEGLASGAYTLTATHPDWTEETERVELKDHPASVEIRLGRGGSIGGAVLAGGRGVAGAAVSLSAAGQLSLGPFGSGQSAITDEGGRFRFDRLSAGRYSLVASLRSQASAPVEAVLQAGESSQEVSLVLAEGATIRGVVTGLAERARANVMVSANGPEEYFANARTGGDGTFEFTGAPKGPISLRASSGDLAGGSRTATAQVVIAEGQTEAAVEIVFEPGFRVEGQVTRGGRAVTDAIVLAMPDGGGGRQSSDRTDETGAFRLEGVPEGTYTLIASSMGGAGGSIRKAGVKVTGDLTIDLEAPPARIAGRVVEAESGRPVAEALVRVEQGGSGPFAMMASDSDSSGRFALESLEPRSYRVTVTKPSYQAETRDVVASEDSDLTFELRRGEGVGLVVRDGMFGTPLRGVLVRVLDPRGATVFTGSVSLDSEGRGDIPSLKPGRYEIRVGADGYASLILPGVAVPAPPLPVSLTPGGTLEIQSGPATLARAGASGRLLDSGGAVYYPFVFSPDGVVRLTGPVRRLDNVAPGHYTFAVDGGPRREFDLREGGTAVVSLP